MQEHELRLKIEAVRSGALPRRSFIAQMVSLGLTAPMASMMLMHEGIAQTVPVIALSQRGGTLKVLWCAARRHAEPALRHRHQGPGRRAASTSRWPAGTPTATSFPAWLPKFPARRTAASRPTARASPGSSRRASPGTTASPSPPTTWSSPWLTPATRPPSTVTIGTYHDIKVEQGRCAHRAHRPSPRPTPFWAEPFVGTAACILPKHVFEGFTGAKSREAAANTKPVGTGPYKFVDFKPGDMVRAADQRLPHAQPSRSSTRWRSRAAATPPARRAPCSRPATSTTPGTCRSSGRVLEQLEAGGKGRVEFTPGATSSSSSCSRSPTRGPRSTTSGPASDTKHPFFRTTRRQVLAMAIDLHGRPQGRAGIPAAAPVN